MYWERIVTPLFCTEEECHDWAVQVFQATIMPNSSNTGLGDALTKESNAAVQRVMEEETTTKVHNHKTSACNTLPPSKGPIRIQKIAF